MHQFTHVHLYSFRHLIRGGNTARWILRRPFSRLFVRLPHRSIVELKGPDGCGFLQGLVTADVIAPTQMVQYAAFLNTQGRVLYDVIVYHVGGERVWLECDSECVKDVIKYTRKYQLRANVTLSHVTDVGVYATMATDQDVKHEDEIIRVSDPRSSSLGYRILIGSSNEGVEQVGSALRGYHQHRMRQGVPEGAGELPPGQCLPFEVNLDILNGVSFTKGCYIGQELTSRTYHTGVMRKRLLSLTLKHSMIDSNIPWGTKIVAESNSGQGLGKVIGHCGDSLLAILRLPNLKDNSGDLWVELQDGTTVEAMYRKPDWLKN